MLILATRLFTAVDRLLCEHRVRVRAGFRAEVKVSGLGLG